MLILEILSSNDETAIGEHSTFRTNLLIGRSRQAHIIINDPTLLRVELQIRLKKEGILIESKNDNGFITNGKKIIGSKFHKVEDIISIGETSFKIKSYTPPQFFSYGEEMAFKIKKTIEDNQELEEVFYFIEKELLELEKELLSEK